MYIQDTEYRMQRGARTMIYKTELTLMDGTIVHETFSCSRENDIARYAKKRGYQVKYIDIIKSYNGTESHISIHSKEEE